MPSNDVLTRNDNGDLSVRTVSATEQATVVNKDDVYTRDTDGNLAVRTVGGSGGGGGAVSSVNGKTGAVVLDAEDVGALPADTTAEDLGALPADTTATDLGAVPQYEELPTPSADNLGEIAQYSGETHGDTGTATISQTVGSGMTDLAVNVQTFIEEEQPTQSEVVDFVCSPSITLGEEKTADTFTVTITDSEAVLAELQKHIGGFSLGYVIQNLVFMQVVYGMYAENDWSVYFLVRDESSNVSFDGSFLATTNGISVSGTAEFGDYQNLDFNGWFKKGNDYVNLDDYGITYGTERTVAIAEHTENVSISSVNEAKFWAKYNSIQHSNSPLAEFAYTADGWYFTDWQTEPEGVYYTTAEVESEWGVVITGTPVADTDWVDLTLGNVADCETGDTLTVDLTFVLGATNGYFYKSEEKYSDATATISQTVGSSLTNLAVDVDTFVAQEQPTQSENVAFVANVIPADTLTPTEFEVEGGVLTVNPTTFLNEYRTLYGEPSNIYMFEVTAKAGNFIMKAYYDNTYLEIEIDPASFGFSYTGDLSELTGETVCQMNYYYSGATIWEKSGNTVDLADYGITYTGTPVDDDTLTVVYTAPVLTGYAWNQINVQPQPEIPEPEPVGIKWATSVDLPENYGYPWDCYPIYTIAGGLPDGTYDFYWQIKINASNDYAIGLVTYHARMKLDNTNNIFYGEFSPVINDAWLPNSSEYIPQANSMQQFLWDNGEGTDLMMFCNHTVWKSDYPRQITGALPECFKISVIKNVDTGVEYTPTGVLFDGNYPQYSRMWSGAITTQPLAPTPYIPTYHLSQLYDYSSSNRYLYLGDRMIDVVNPRCSEYDFSAETSSGGRYHIIVEITPNKYIARVIEASGDLATAKLGLVGNNLYFDFNSAGNSGKIKVFIGTKGSNSEPICYYADPSSAITPIDIANVGETVTINNLGLIEQYKGATDANYTNGYFYKSEGTIVVTPQSMVASNIKINDVIVNDVTISIDIANLILAIQNQTGWSQDYIKQQLAASPNWDIEYDFDNSTINTVYWAAFGRFYGASDIFSCFTITTTGSYSGNQYIFFTSTYTPETKSVTGGTWTRVNVQPLDLTGVTGYDATKTQVLKNVQGTLTWVDE